jgi:hypothetical protein
MPRRYLTSPLGPTCTAAHRAFTDTLLRPVQDTLHIFQHLVVGFTPSLYPVGPGRGHPLRRAVGLAVRASHPSAGWVLNRTRRWRLLRQIRSFGEFGTLARPEPYRLPQVVIGGRIVR